MKRFIKDGVIKNRIDIVLQKESLSRSGKTETLYIYNPNDSELEAQGWMPYEVVVSELELALTRLTNEVKQYDKSNELNSFYFLDGEYVLDKNTRVGLTRRIEAEKANEFTKTKVWLEEVTSKEMMCLNINIEVFEKFLNSLEVYAAQCFDATNTILGVIKQKQDIEELNQFDYKSYYPEKLTLKV